MTMRHHPRFQYWLKTHSGELDAILFDIDGTLIAGRKGMPGASALLDELLARKIPYLLLTNDGNHSVEEKSRMTAKAGLDIPPELFVSCSMPLSIFVEENRRHGQKFFVMGDLGKPCFAEKAGLRVERNPKLIAGCKGVIVGEGSYDWQSAFFAVMNFFMKNPSAPLLVPNPDSYWPNGPDGEIGIGAGGKARFICTILREYGIIIHPVYFGKPHKLIFDFAIRRLAQLYPQHPGFRKKRMLMIGDSLRSDIRGGNRFGIRTALILTGITKPPHLKNLDKCLRPELVFDRLA